VLDRSRQRRIPGQSQMWPDIVVVSGIRRKNATQVILAQDHDVIEALPTDRADQPLHMSVLPNGFSTSGCWTAGHSQGRGDRCIAGFPPGLRRLGVKPGHCLMSAG
jgi:hypothetical protein